MKNDSLKWIIPSSIALIIGLIVISFVLQIIGVKTDVLGQNGDFIGGFLNPILSLFVLIILYSDLRLSREDLSVTAKAAQDQANYLMPKEKIIAYPFCKFMDSGNGIIFYIKLSNIGMVEVYDLTIKLEVHDLSRDWGKIELPKDRVYNPKILAPKQEISYLLFESRSSIIYSKAFEGSALHTSIYVDIDYYLSPLEEEKNKRSISFEFNLHDIKGAFPII
ncbi:MAG: hypothetical protein HUU10_10535 [Bacteroidetes bacterium]|nr:hypothetical protein [Bacteroidota bacterium]